MILDYLGRLSEGVLLLSLAAHTVLSASLAWLVLRHLQLRRRRLAAEVALLGRRLPADDRLPHVLVQIPTFNERQLIRRIACSVAAFDWPRDKLHIQLLDDSTDESAAAAVETAGALRAAGLDAVLLHRTNRAGFKAGALRDGLGAA
jgi:cellulose synthase/poly-beta-1,6-N-acetylglucosamine synthase-like glycosyltransferase